MKPSPNHNQKKGPLLQRPERPIDRLIKSSWQLLGKEVLLVGKTRISSWKALTLITFVAGFVGALVWAVQFEPERLSGLVAQLQPPQVENIARFSYEDAQSTRSEGTSNRVAVTILEPSGASPEPDEGAPPPAASVCGNGQCESGEDSASCSADCPAPTPPASQPPSGNVSLSLQPPSGSVKVGETFDVAIRLNTAGQDIDGVDLHYLRFPAALLEVVDSDPAASGVQVQAGAILDITDLNTVDNTAGTIDFSRTASGGNTFKGSGTLATVTFKTKAEGTAELSFDFTAGVTTDTNVAAGVAEDVLASVSGGSYEIQPLPPRPFNIVHRKQGRGDYSGHVIIRLYEVGTHNVVAEVNGNATAQGRGQGLTAQSFIPDGTYDVLIKIPHHLTKKLTGVTWPPSIDLDFGEVQGGNLQDSDDVINSLDWSLMNGAWGTADLAADINGDGIVNTIDWSVMNRNWGQQGAL